MRGKKRITLLAPAKVNLFLEVLGRRPDGYHDLVTVFARLELSDELTLVPAPKLSLSIIDEAGTGAPAGPGNLVWKAAEAFRRRFGGPAARFRLVKRIPAGAGLGGGSSDAAAALKGLARLTPVPRAALKTLARRLGADVPFFLEDAPVCQGRGVGERLRPLRAPRPPWLVVVYPGVQVSTAEAYERLRSRRGPSLTALSNFYKLRLSLQKAASPESWAALLFNRLEQPVFEMCRESARARDALEALGARARLSGSGSCVFAVAPTSSAARGWAAAVRRDAPSAWKIFVSRIQVGG